MRRCSTKAMLGQNRILGEHFELRQAGSSLQPENDGDHILQDMLMVPIRYAGKVLGGSVRQIILDSLQIGS